jgi:hypothetical protein
MSESGQVRPSQDYERGYARAVLDMTHLNTMLNDRRTQEALRRLVRYLDQQDEEFESLEASPLWRTER